ncbi:hypothetical protein ACN47E_008178 [Coniothyrium glycines]
MMGLTDFVATLVAAAPLPLQTLAAACWRNKTCDGAGEPAFPGHWQSGIYAPSSRDVRPSSVFTTRGSESITLLQ